MGRLGLQGAGGEGRGAESKGGGWNERAQLTHEDGPDPFSPVLGLQVQPP